MTKEIIIFEIDGARVKLLETYTNVDTELGKVTLTITARVHYQSPQSRKKAFKILRDNGWIKSLAVSDDFHLRKVVQDELKIDVTGVK